MNSTRGDGLGDERCGLADVAADEVGAGYLDEVPGGQQAQLGIYGGDQPATVVLAVPGGPVKIMCREDLAAGSPASRRSRSALAAAASSRTWCLTDARP